MKKIKLFLIILLMGLGLSLASCGTITTAPKEDVIQKNLNRQTGNFETYRKITVINLRSDKVLMEFIGYLTTKIDSEGDVDIMIMTGPNQYKMHYFRKAPEITYLSEQLENSTTDPYHWEINIYAVVPGIKIG